MAEAVHLGQDECRTLALRQLAQTFEHAAHLLALLDLLDGVGAGRDLAVELDDRTAPPQDAEAVVARNREQPRPQRDRAAVSAKRPVGGRERGLHGVLRVLARAEHVDAEAEQLTDVAVVERFESGCVPAAHAADEPLVGRQPQPHTRAHSDQPTALGHFRLPLLLFPN